MAPGSRNSSNIAQYASGSAYQCALDATGKATTWALIGWTQGTKISTEVQATDVEEIDDGGDIVYTYHDEQLKSAKIEGVFIERDQSVRNSLTGTSVGTKYAYCIVGAALAGSKREIWVFPNVTYSQVFSYSIGSEKPRFPFVLNATTSLTGYSMTLPDSYGTTAIAQGDIYKTFDV